MIIRLQWIKRKIVNKIRGKKLINNRKVVKKKKKKGGACDYLVKFDRVECRLPVAVFRTWLARA